MSSPSTSETIFDGDDVGIGDLVFDHDADHANPAIVVNTPPKTADEWKAYAGTTVAEDNPEYPADASIIVVVFRNEILDEQPEMVAPDSPIPLQNLNEVGIKHYSFPAPRLRHADPEIDDFETLEDLEELDDIDINGDGTDDGSGATSEDGQTETSETDTDTEPADTTATNQDAGTAETEDTADEQEVEQELEQLTEFLRDNGVRSEIDGSVVVAEKLGESYEITLDGEVNGGGAFQNRLEQLASEYTS